MSASLESVNTARLLVLNSLVADVRVAHRESQRVPIRTLFDADRQTLGICDRAQPFPGIDTHEQFGDFRIASNTDDDTSPRLVFFGGADSHAAGIVRRYSFRQSDITVSRRLYRDHRRLATRRPHGFGT